MTYTKVQKVLKKYHKILGAHIVERGAKCKLCHIKWMLEEMLQWPESRLDKAFRWLGFIQGVFFCEKVYTINEMKEHNRPNV